MKEEYSTAPNSTFAIRLTYSNAFGTSQTHKPLMYIYPVVRWYKFG